MTNKVFAIIGSRGFNDYRLMVEFIDGVITETGSTPSVIVSGGAEGADILGGQYANERKIPLMVHLPNWNEFGKSAGMVRNTIIVKQSDIVIAFWDGKSKGTKDSMTKAKVYGKQLFVCNYNEPQDLSEFL